MSSQNDNPFNDDEDILDAEMTDQPSTLSGAEIKDISDESVEDISDYDDSEEGIFSANAPVKKKSSSSSMLLGTVALIALLGAGGFYVSQTPELLDKVKSMIPMASLQESIAPVAEIAGQSPIAVGDSELASIPQPQPIANVDDGASASPVSSDPAPETTAMDSAAPVDMAATPAPIEAPVAEPAPTVEAPVAADIPAPPTPDETQTAVEASSQPAAATPAEASPQPAVSEPAPVVTEAAKETAAPTQADLAPVAAVATEKSGKSSTNVVTKPARDEKTEYFDSPSGNILKKLPAPAMSAKRGISESIIVVTKPNKVGKAVVSAETTQESRVVAANRALRLGRYDAALDLYEQLYKANPRDGRILMGRAVALQKLGRISDSIESYEALLDMDPDNPEAIVNLMGLIRKEYPAVALEKLLGLKERHPNNPAIIAQLGIAYADAGNLDQATAALKRAIFLEPNNAQHYFNLGVIAERMKDRPRAIEMYEKALETDAVYGSGRAIDRNMIYDRLTRIRG